MKRLLRFLFRIDHLVYRLWYLTLALVFLTGCTRPCALVNPPFSPDQLRAQSVRECHDRGDDTPKCVQTQYAANIGWYYYRNPEVKR